MTSKKIARPLILLDRDGTLIEERHYLSDPAQVKLLPGVVDGLRRLKRAGFLLVVVSNQSGIGRGKITLKQAERVSRRFQDLLKVKKIKMDGVYLCPHRPSARCSCRKPKLGMVKCAARDLMVSWKKSISVGDRPSDVQTGQKTGGQGVLVFSGYGRAWSKKWTGRKPDHRAKDFKQAANWILNETARNGYGK